MTDEHEQLYEAALKAIIALFNDTSVPSGETKRDLYEIKYEIDTLVDSMDL